MEYLIAEYDFYVSRVYVWFLFSLMYVFFYNYTTLSATAIAIQWRISKILFESLSSSRFCVSLVDLKSELFSTIGFCDTATRPLFLNLKRLNSNLHVFSETKKIEVNNIRRAFTVRPKHVDWTELDWFVSLLN